MCNARASGDGGLQQHAACTTQPWNSQLKMESRRSSAYRKRTSYTRLLGSLPSRPNLVINRTEQNDNQEAQMAMEWLMLDALMESKRREGPSQRESLAKPLQPIPAHHLPTPDSLRRSVGTCNRCMPTRLHTRSWGEARGPQPRTAGCVQHLLSPQPSIEIGSAEQCAAPPVHMSAAKSPPPEGTVVGRGCTSSKEYLSNTPPFPPADQSSVKGSDCRVPKHSGHRGVLLA